MQDSIDEALAFASAHCTAAEVSAAEKAIKSVVESGALDGCPMEITTKWRTPNETKLCWLFEIAASSTSYSSARDSSLMIDIFSLAISKGFGSDQAVKSTPTEPTAAEQTIALLPKPSDEKKGFPTRAEASIAISALRAHNTILHMLRINSMTIPSNAKIWSQLNEKDRLLFSGGSTEVCRILTAVIAQIENLDHQNIKTIYGGASTRVNASDEVRFRAVSEDWFAWVGSLNDTQYRRFSQIGHE